MIKRTKRNVRIVKWTAFLLTLLSAVLFLWAAKWHFNYGLSPVHMIAPVVMYIVFGVSWCNLIELYDEWYGEGAKG